jgi:hypothetical protein
MIGLLTNAPKDTSPQQIIETMRAEAESAYLDLDAETAKTIKIPKLVAVNPDAQIAEREEEITALKTENDSLKERLLNLESVPEHLRDENITANLAAEPDCGIASIKMTAYLHSIVDRILPHHMKTASPSATVSIVGRDCRIMPDDWLQKKNKQSEPMSLAKCTGTKEFMHRRVISEWDGGAWSKEHFILNNQEHIYTVITEAAARLLEPRAFEEGGGK